MANCSKRNIRRSCTRLRVTEYSLSNVRPCFADICPRLWRFRHKTDPQGFDDLRCEFLAVHFGDQCRQSAVRPFCADRTIKLSFAVVRGPYARFRPAALRKPHITGARVCRRNNGSNFRFSVTGFLWYCTSCVSLIGGRTLQ